MIINRRTVGCNFDRVTPFRPIVIQLNIVVFGEYCRPGVGSRAERLKLHERTLIALYRVQKVRCRERQGFEGQ